MSNNIEILRAHLFNALDALADKNNPMDIERAKAISDVSQTIIDAASASAIKNLAADAIAFTNEQPTRRAFIHLADALVSAGIPPIDGHADLAVLSDELHPMFIEADRLAQLQQCQEIYAYLSKPLPQVPATSPLFTELALSPSPACLSPETNLATSLSPSAPDLEHPQMFA